MISWIVDQKNPPPRVGERLAYLGSTVEFRHRDMGHIFTSGKETTRDLVNGYAVSMDKFWLVFCRDSGSCSCVWLLAQRFVDDMGGDVLFAYRHSIIDCCLATCEVAILSICGRVSN